MTENEIMNLMNDIEYGWIDKHNHKYYKDDNSNNFLYEYILQSPEEVMKNKVGVCWDQVELERHLFSSIGYNVKTFFLVHYDNEKCPTHTFLTFKKNKKFYWFEHSWEKYKGIHEYNSMKQLLLDVRDKFIKNQLDNYFDQNNLLLREYVKPKDHILAQEFCKHCEKIAPINLDKL